MTKKQAQQDVVEKEKENEFYTDYSELIMDKNYDPDVEYVTAPIDALGPPGLWIRHRLLESILYGTPVLVAIQQLRNRTFTRFMKYASFLGTEEFYAILVCVLVWIVDLRLGRLACFAMGIGFYVANAVKNSLCLPRPPSPPVIPLEDAYYTWGLPSHHSVLGVVCPWYIWFYCLLHYHLHTFTLVCLFLLICTWSFVVLFCRIYNGVHSPADVVAGSLLGCLIVAFMNSYDSLIDSSIYGLYSLILPVWLAIFLVIHPYNEIGLPAFEESISMGSASVGFMLGRAFSQSRSQPLKALLETYTIGESSLLWVLIAGFSRFVVGAILVVITKESVKKLTEIVIGGCLKLLNISFIKKSPKYKIYTGYSAKYALPPIYKNKREREGTDDDQSDDEEVDKTETKSSTTVAEPLNIGHYSRFFSYMGMGFTAYYLNTLLCQNLGLVL